MMKKGGIVEWMEECSHCESKCCGKNTEKLEWNLVDVTLGSFVCPVKSEYLRIFKIGNDVNENIFI